MNIIGMIGLAVGIFAFIFSILATALPYWETIDTGGIEGNAGLFHYCVKVGSNEKVCGDPADVYDNANDENSLSALKACRAFAILGLLFIFGSLVIISSLLFVLKDKKILGFIAGGVAICGGVFVMIAMAVFAGELHDNDNDSNYSAGFAFDILAWIAAWITGALFIGAALKGYSG